MNDDHVPETQSRQTLTVVAPSVTEYVPASQFTHCIDADNPVMEDHVPPTHCEHDAMLVDPIATEYVPE